ncbi:hypothetical protein IU447_24110 [Nocardia farcinica]|uniref:hypothetical protein n=1 Tax=Nocardia farcinica TaxID=37329 RepID=UPI0018943A7E|nr:hypothetical protein [Nocardia farcinica]MBF6363205.1 hypothetical protein [Nocardia farcinica]
MSDTTAAAAEMETEGTEQEQQEQRPKPTETVDHWKAKSREWEKRAKAGADAIKELEAIKEAQKSDAEKAADKVKAAEAEVAAVPSKVADALREHLVKLHSIDAEDAELFLTATDPELLLKQVDRLIGQSDKRTKRNHVPREGQTAARSGDELRDFTRELFSGGA